MGIGYSFTCSKCGKKYGTSCGSGYMFPVEYEEIMKAIRAGEYGTEWQKLEAENDYVVVDAEKYIYLCKKCHNWQSEPAMSLYVPRDLEAIKKKHSLESCKELKDLSFVIPWEIKKVYRILRRYVHVCKKCRGIMHKATKEELESLPCPECGSAPKEPGTNGMICWD